MTSVTKTSGGFLVGLGLFVATISWVALAIQLTVLDAERLADSASELLQTDQVRDALSGKVEDQLAEVTAVDIPPSELDAAADATLDDPRFVRAFEDALIALHERVFQGSDTTLILDGGQVGAATRSGVENVDPALAQQVPTDLRLDISLTEIDEIPDLSWVDRLVTLIALIGLMGAVALLASGVATTNERPRALARIGRWAIVLAGAQLLAALLLPWIFRAIASGGWPEVGVRSWEAFAAGLVVPAILLAIIGTGLLVAAQWLRRSQPAGGTPVTASAPPPAAPVAPAPREPAPAPDADSARERVRDWVWPDS